MTQLMKSQNSQKSQYQKSKRINRSQMIEEELNDCEMLDLYKELQTRDPSKSNIFKTLEFQYEKSPDIVDKLLLQIFLKSVGLGAIAYLIPKINIYGLSIEDFLKNNLYKKFNYFNNSIENLMDSKNPEDAVFKLNLIKFFDLMFSENCSLFDINHRLYKNFNQWVQEISLCKVNIVRLQILEIAEILFSSGGKYLKFLTDQLAYEQKRAQESIATYFIRSQSQINDKKQDQLEKKMQKIRSFLNEVFNVIIQRQMDSNNEVRHKSVNMFVNCVKFLPQLFLQNQFLLEHFNLIDGIDLKLRQIICKNILELFKIGRVNEVYLKEILQTCKIVKRQLMINFNEKDLKFYSEFYQLLGEILENDVNFLDQNEKKMIISLIISKICISSHEMRIIQVLLFGKDSVKEDFTQELFMHQKEENYNIIINQLFTFIQEINLINNQVFNSDQMIKQVVKNLYQQKMSFILSFPLILDALSLDRNFNGKKQNQTILIKLLVHSIQECMNLKTSSHQKNDKEKFIKLHEIFDKSLQYSCLKILNRLKDLQQEEEISLFLQLFSFIQVDSLGEEFQSCLNQIINTSLYYFTQSPNTLVYDRISKLVFNLRERKVPSLEQIINNFTDKLLSHMTNQIETQSQQAHQIFKEESPEGVLVTDLQEKFLPTMLKITIFTQNNINSCDFQWDQVNKLWHLCYVLHVNSYSHQIDQQTIMSCNQLLYNTFTSYLQRLLTQYNPVYYQEFNSVKTALLEDCKNFLLNRQSLTKFGHDQVMILLDQFYYHLTQTLEVLCNEEYSSINPIYINPYSEECIELNKSLCEYMLLFGESQNLEELNGDEFKQLIQEKITQEDPFYTKKLHQMMLQSLKIVQISSEIGPFTLVSQIGLTFFDSKIDCIKRYMHRYWQILKNKEVSQLHQSKLIFWRVGLNGIHYFLNHNDKNQCLKFCQILKKNFFQLEKFHKNQIEISKQKYAVFILKGIEDFLKSNQLYYGFQMLQLIMDENKQFLGTEWYKRIFAFLLKEIENQKSVLDQNSQQILDNSPDFQFVLNFSDFMMRLARLTKIQIDEASQEVNNELIPQNLIIKNNQSVNFSRTIENVVPNSTEKQYLDETKIQMNFNLIDEKDQLSGNKLKKY